MNLDWPRILNAQGVEFVETGPSTARGNIYTRCPFCGEDDQGHHMGISLSGKGWGCWRREAHRGKAPDKLLAALLRISRQQARNILGIGAPDLTSDASLSDRVKAAMAFNTPIAAAKRIKLPKEIKKLTKSYYRSPHQMIFASYLHERGYKWKQMSTLFHRYLLHYAVEGPFGYRLIFPVYDSLGLASWTGRSVADDDLRYRTLSTDPEKATKSGLPVARAPISDLLFNEANLMNGSGNALVLCEGPFDAMRVDFACRGTGIRATCLFGKRVSDAQVEKLVHLSNQYDVKIFLLDKDALLDRFAMMERLSSAHFSMARLPSAWKDPGEAPLMDLKEFVIDALDSSGSPRPREHR